MVNRVFFFLIFTLLTLRAGAATDAASGAVIGAASGGRAPASSASVSTSTSFGTPPKLPATFSLPKLGKSQNLPVDHSGEELLTYPDFVSLTTEDQALYVNAIRHLVEDLEADDLAHNVQYQTAVSSLSFFLPEADASGEDRRCVYAGWISEMNMAGTHCMTPRQEKKCSRGFIQCNPAIYGTIPCVHGGGGATSTCKRSGKTPSQVASELREKGGMQKWSNARASLGAYCASPMPSQKNVCGIVRSRLTAITRIVGKGPKPTVRATRVARRSRATPSGRSGAPESGGSVAAPESGATQSPAGDAETVSVRTAQTPAQSNDEITLAPLGTTASSKAVDPGDLKIGSLTLTSRDCNPNSLLGNTRPTGNRDPSMGGPLMDFQHAQYMMCTTGALTNDWTTYYRGVLSDRLRRVTGSDEDARTDRRNFSTLLSNFNACVRDANSERQSGSIYDFPGNSGTVVLDGGVGLSYIDPKTGQTGQGSDAEGVLKTLNLSLCRTQTQSRSSYTTPSSFGSDGTR